MGFWDGRKVLVTGGAGFIGSRLVEMLAEPGDAEVTAADDLSSGRRENLEKVSGRIRLLECDLRRPGECARACRGMDTVLHLAARVGGVGYNAAHPALMYRENARLSTYMLEEAQKAGVERFLVVSSACVYARHCPVPTPETEGFVGRPEDTNEGYGWAKRMAEFEAMAVHRESGMKAAVVRPYNCYGPRDRFEPEVSHVIPALIRRVVGGEDPVRVWGDGSQTRSFLYVDDLARGLLLAAERCAACDPVNIGTDEEVSIRDLIGMILESAGSKARPEFDESMPSGQPRRCCDTRKAAQMLGFRAEVPLREGLRRTIAWYKDSLAARRSA